MYKAEIKLCNTVIAKLSGGIHMNGWIESLAFLMLYEMVALVCLNKRSRHIFQEDIFLLKNLI